MTGNTWMDIGYGVIGVIVALLGVFAHKKLNVSVPKSVQPLVGEVENVTRTVVQDAEGLIHNGHEAVVAHNALQAVKAESASRLAQTVDKLSLQYAGAAGKTVAQLTGADIQNVIAYVLHTLDPIDAHHTAPKTVVDAHAALVKAHQVLASDPTFIAAQTSAAYQAETAAASQKAAASA